MEEANEDVLDLMLNLCTELSKNNSDLKRILYKKALSMMSTTCQACANPSEEVYYVEKLKDYSVKKSEEFDLVYAKIFNSKILKHRPSIIKFLYCFINKNSSTNDNCISGAFDMLNTLQGNRSSIVIKNSICSSLTLTGNKQIRHNLESLSGNFVEEQELLKDVVYMLTGFEGRYIKFQRDSFAIDPKSLPLINPTHVALINRLIGIGFLHNQIQKHCVEIEKRGGFVCQALSGALNRELAVYYKDIALLQTMINMEGNNVTLRRMLCLIHKQQLKLEWLAYIAEECSEKTGGNVISAVYDFSQHGSKNAHNAMMLKAVCQPLYSMLLDWLSEGAINDPWGEFFIESKPSVAIEDFWNKKYRVKSAMVPKFVSNSQAMKILDVGKCINFLKAVCRNEEKFDGNVHDMFANISADGLYDIEQNQELCSILDALHKETSSKVLNLMLEKFKLNRHLLALRRYLLLEQGDFAYRLLELLTLELNKPAHQIYLHTLTVILESTIEESNAQFEDRDVIRRIIVRLSEPTNKADRGWDVFSLSYIIDGPLSIIFQQSVLEYQTLFSAFFKAKRTESTLRKIRQKHLMMGKVFRCIKELKTVTRRIDCLLNKMVHFIYQTQYYFLEVLDGCWMEMQLKMGKASCLDDVILAHENFLKALQRGMLLTEDSRVIFSHLVSIYNFISDLETCQELLYDTSLNEKKFYEEYRKRCEDPTGISIKEQQAHRLRQANFREYLKATCVKLKIQSEMYDDTVKRFLNYLTRSEKNNLMLYSVKLNFNNFFSKNC